MMFSLKQVIFFGLLATSVAQPTLDPRAKVKEINCDGTEWSKDQINHSKRQARDLENSGYAYPKKFGNKDASGNDIFGAKGQLWEFPLTDPLWTSESLSNIFELRDPYFSWNATAAKCFRRSFSRDLSGHCQGQLRLRGSHKQGRRDRWYRP